MNFYDKFKLHTDYLLVLKHNLRLKLKNVMSQIKLTSNLILLTLMSIIKKLMTIKMSRFKA